MRDILRLWDTCAICRIPRWKSLRRDYRTVLRNSLSTRGEAPFLPACRISKWSGASRGSGTNRLKLFSDDGSAILPRRMAIKTSPVDMEARKNLDLRVGDTVRVHQKIEEKGKTRLQVFEGLVLARKHGTEAGGTFTGRRVASGVGVEKIFPLYSPMIDKVEVVKRSRFRRAKLYFIPAKGARAAP